MQPLVTDREVALTPVAANAAARHAPRQSVIMIVNEGAKADVAFLDSVFPSALAAATGAGEREQAPPDLEVDLIVACAGQPADLRAWQMRMTGAQWLLAPAGTSAETLREMAMQRATGDIVTLVSRDQAPADGAQA